MTEIVCDAEICWNPKHYEERCPGCDSVLLAGVCHFTYTTWRCPGCGGVVDSRTGAPKFAHVAAAASTEDTQP